MQKLLKIRKMQFGGFLVAMFMYLFVYRRFFMPKSVYNGTVYNQAIRYIRRDKKVG